MMLIRFLLVCEGPSDTSLVSHIRRLIVHRGMPDPEAGYWHKSGTLDVKIRDGLKYFGDCDLLLIHRDADSDVETSSSGPEKRRQEISSAVIDSGFLGPWVAIVPVQTTESWLLLDENTIREISGRRSGVTPLNLPPLHRVEQESDPKGTLRQALIAGSDTNGKRDEISSGIFLCTGVNCWTTSPLLVPLNQFHLGFALGTI